MGVRSFFKRAVKSVPVAGDVLGSLLGWDYPTPPSLDSVPRPERRPFDQATSDELTRRAADEYYGVLNREGPREIYAPVVGDPNFRRVAQMGDPGSVDVPDAGQARAVAAPGAYAPTAIRRQSPVVVTGFDPAQAKRTEIDRSAEEESAAGQRQLKGKLFERVEGKSTSAAAEQLGAGLSKIQKRLSSTAGSKRFAGGRSLKDLLDADAAAMGEANNQLAVLRAKEQQDAEGLLAGLLGTMREGDQRVFLKQADLDQQTGLFNTQATNEAGQRLADAQNAAKVAEYQTESGLNAQEAGMEAQRKKDEWTAKFDADKFNADWSNRFADKNADRTLTGRLADMENKVRVGLANMDARNKDNWFRTEKEMAVKFFNADMAFKADAENVKNFLEDRRIDDGAKAAFLGLMGQMLQLREQARQSDNQLDFNYWGKEIDQILKLYEIKQKAAEAQQGAYIGLVGAASKLVKPGGGG